MFQYLVHGKSLVKCGCYYYCCCHRNSLLSLHAWKREKIRLEELNFSHLPKLRDRTQAAESWWTIHPPAHAEEFKTEEREQGREKRVARARVRIHCFPSATALESSRLHPQAWLPRSHDKAQATVARPFSEGQKDLIGWHSPWSPSQFIGRTMESQLFQFSEGKRGNPIKPEALVPRGLSGVGRGRVCTSSGCTAHAP